ncbi:MAG: leucine-rich repeat domain-containing protein [Clostridiales bacterium]|nr:leucine-rich repeat domain-containing protein [Clostridiales bacterium]
MKKNLLRIFAIGSALFFLLSFAACDKENILLKGEGGQATVKYRSNDSGVSLYRYKGTSDILAYTVPDEYEGSPVTALMEFSFANSEYLQELTLGPNINSIDVWALTNCSKLKSITVSKDNQWFKDIDGVLYTKNGDTLLAFPSMNTTALIIPAGVERIAANAFYKCSNLVSVQFPSGLKTIGDRAFLKCKALTAVNLPGGLTTIGNDAFSFCHAMEDVYVASSVTSIGNYAFFDATKVSAIKMEALNGDKITFGKDWKYKKDAKFNSDIPVEWGVQQ